MKVLLTTLNSKYIHSNLALKYLYAVGKDYFDHLDIREFTINNNQDYIYTELVRGGYDMVCFSCYIWNIEDTLYLCENLKKALPDMEILLGGPEVSFEAHKLLQEHPYIDYVISGEGEEAFKAFAQSMETGVPKLSEVPALSYRRDRTVYVNPVKPSVNMDSVPFPYDYLPLDEDRIIYYESSRGCPFGCSYCLSSIDKGVRSLPASRVKRELGYFICNNVKQVKLIDRTFNYDIKRACDILRYLIYRDNGLTNFHFELCGDLITDEFLMVCSKARKGQFQFEIGIQSTNPDALQAVSRHGDLLATFRNVKKLIGLGNSEVHIDLITGLPYENLESFKASFNDAYALGADCLQLGFLKMLKGTGIRAEDGQYSYIYRSKAPYEVISNEFMDSRQMVTVKQLETVLDLYYNRGGYSRSLRVLIAACGNNPYEFFREFSSYYYLKGYQHANHSKEDQYRILYNYACWKSEVMKVRLVKDKAIDALEADLSERMDVDAIRRFRKKGWKL